MWKPFLDEVAIETLTNLGGKPCVIATLDFFEAFFRDCDSVVAAEDVLTLMSALCHHARKAGHGDPDLAQARKAWYDHRQRAEWPAEDEEG